MSRTLAREDEPAPKRRKMDNSIQLSCSDYTVGWICALPTELAAAKAMLDVIHVPPTKPPIDTNSYSVGSICGHNVAITCLPSRGIGTNRAAIVATNMMATFRSITIPLLVGIGGGVPRSGYDIRLGDVVVSTPASEPPYQAVVQYDFGQTINNGISQHRGTLNKPKNRVLSAAVYMEANHRLNGSDVPRFISTALGNPFLVGNSYSYPGAEEDELYELDCVHGMGCSDGSACEKVRKVKRIPRPDTSPMIHYGGIGSGNQVLKDGRTRDRLAAEFNVLCFEMEAAGLMDDFQPLVIRGISDYCDGFKAKKFQGYAALAAAAVAKELLYIIREDKLSSTTPKETLSALQLLPNLVEHRRNIMDTLDFDESESRRATVKKAHAKTCRWLLVQPEYVDWLKHHKYSEHRGLLWIKGKPGTGKSTIMKFALEQQLKERDPDLVIISFFFNARGHELEKSTMGMYRSLLHQLLKEIPAMQTLLDDFSMSTVSSMAIDRIEDVLRRAILLLGSRRLVCFVDALDECPEEQIRRMVHFFEEIGESAEFHHLYFHVLFSSRHYPHISTDVGRILVLEEQDGHSQDLVEYIKAKLKIGKSKRVDDIKAELLQKSNQIFLWVVLVIQILNFEFDRGNIMRLKKKLQVYPWSWMT